MIVELLRESVLIQAIITLILVCAVSLMAVRGDAPPDWMIQVLMVVIGFYFGSKTERAIQRYGAR